MSAIPFKTEMDFTYGEVTHMSPRIRRVIANNPSAFTFTGTGTYIIGTGQVAVIDPGPLLDDHVEAILNALEPGETITHIVITHTHSDHSPAAAPLKEKTGAPIYGHAPIMVQAEDSQVQLEEDQDENYRPDYIVKDGDIIAGNDWTLEAVTTPGHMRNHICYALQEEKTLFTGDHVMGWSTSIVAPPEGSMFDYMASLNKLLERDDVLYMPTHGPVIDDPRNFVKAYIEHRKGRENQIIQQLKSGQTNIREMVTILYAAVDKRLHPAAALSVFAHMQDLVQRGHVVSSQMPPTLNASFTLKEG